MHVNWFWKHTKNIIITINFFSWWWGHTGLIDMFCETRMLQSSLLHILLPKNLTHDKSNDHWNSMVYWVILGELPLLKKPQPFSLALKSTNSGGAPFALQWCHNECHGISNHRHLDCLLNCSFRCRSKKTSKLHITNLCAGNSPVIGEFLQNGQWRGKCFHLMTSSLQDFPQSTYQQLDVAGQFWGHPLFALGLTCLLCS